MALSAAAQTTEFNYQGRLTEGGSSPTGSYDFEFRLYDDSNNLLGTLTRLGVAVTNGSFSVTLDYGSSPNQFTGGPRLLEIAVRPAGVGSFTTLTPRQAISSSPYAYTDCQTGTDAKRDRGDVERAADGVTPAPDGDTDAFDLFWWNNLTKCADPPPNGTDGSEDRNKRSE